MARRVTVSHAPVGVDSPPSALNYLAPSVCLKERWGSGALLPLDASCENVVWSPYNLIGSEQQCIFTTP
eukprot:665126-Pelagomonas_calceolata.AAC.1